MSVKYPRVMNKIAFGRYMIDAATNDEKRQRLLADPDGELAQFVEVPEGHKFVIHEDTPLEGATMETHLMLPARGRVQESLHKMEDNGYSFPEEYDPNSPSGIRTEDDPLRAYSFRVGDYMLSRCV